MRALERAREELPPCARPHTRPPAPLIGRSLFSGCCRGRHLSQLLCLSGGLCSGSLVLAAGLLLLLLLFSSIAYVGRRGIWGFVPPFGAFWAERGAESPVWPHLGFWVRVNPRRRTKQAPRELGHFGACPRETGMRARNGAFSADEPACRPEDAQTNMGTQLAHSNELA